MKKAKKPCRCGRKIVRKLMCSGCKVCVAYCICDKLKVAEAVAGA